MKSVYEISKEFMEIEELQSKVDEETGEFLYSEEEIQEKISKLNETREQKAFNICALATSVSGNIEMLANENRRISALKKSEENKLKRLKNYLDMLANGEKIDAGVFKVSYRSSESICIEDENKVPPEYITFTKKIQNNELKKAIKSGKVEATEDFYIKRNKNVGFK